MQSTQKNDRDRETVLNIARRIIRRHQGDLVSGALFLVIAGSMAAALVAQSMMPKPCAPTWLSAGQPVPIDDQQILVIYAYQDGRIVPYARPFPKHDREFVHALEVAHSPVQLLLLQKSHEAGN